MDRGSLEREMLRSGMVLACGTVPCFSLLPGQVPPILLKAERVSSPESPPLLWYVTSREAVSWSGMGSLALLLWYTPHAEGEGGRVPVPPLLCLRKDPRAPSHLQPLGTNVLPEWGQSWTPCSVHLPVSSMQQDICSLPGSPSLGQGCYPVACP